MHKCLQLVGSHHALILGLLDLGFVQVIEYPTVEISIEHPAK